MRVLACVSVKGGGQYSCVCVRALVRRACTCALCLHLCFVLTCRLASSPNELNEAYEQIAVADRILINKIDLVEPKVSPNASHLCSHNDVHVSSSSDYAYCRRSASWSSAYVPSIPTPRYSFFSVLFHFMKWRIVC